VSLKSSDGTEVRCRAKNGFDIEFNTTVSNYDGIRIVSFETVMGVTERFMNAKVDRCSYGLNSFVEHPNRGHIQALLGAIQPLYSPSIPAKSLRK